MDFSIVVAGAMTATLLGDFGAEVVKVERPGVGDPLRAWGPFKHGFSLWWKAHSRNKKSITLNLAKSEGQSIARELVSKADVVVESYQPGTMEKWGLGHDTLLEANPRLVMMRLSGFGQTGPYKDRPGFGTIAESMSGIVHLTGFPDGAPVLPAFPIADELAGTLGAMAVMMAIYHRDRSGEGQWIDTSLYEPLFRHLIPNVPEYDQTGFVRQRTGNEQPDLAPRNLYKCKDGRWLSLSASTQGTFEQLVQSIGRPDMLEDARFKDNDSRVRNREALNAILQERIGAYPLDEILETMRGGGAVVGPVYDTAMIMDDPHYAAREDIVSVPDPDLGSLKMPTAIPKFSRTPGHVYSTGPSLSEHNDSVYGEWLGYGRERLSALRAEGTI